MADTAVGLSFGTCKAPTAVPLQEVCPYTCCVTYDANNPNRLDDTCMYCIRQRSLAIEHGTIHPDAHVLLDVHTQTFHSTDLNAFILNSA